MIQSNGLFIAFGIACGALWSTYRAKKNNHDPEIIYYLFLPLTIWGLIGARLWHIFTPPLSSVQLGLTTQHYLSHPIDAFALWIGGFGIPGAILGGSMSLYNFCRKYELPFWGLADILAPGVLLAQIIGRLANYFNQELYGLPTQLPWGIWIEPASRISTYESFEYYHPLFAYEMILNIINLIVFLWIEKRFQVRYHAGDLFLFYLCFYSLSRFLLEFVRLDVSLVNGININQVFFALLFGFCVLIRVKKVRHEAPSLDL